MIDEKFERHVSTSPDFRYNFVMAVWRENKLLWRRRRIRSNVGGGKR